MRIRSLIFSAILVVQHLIVATALADINSSFLHKKVLPNGSIYSGDSASPQQSTAQSLMAMKMLGDNIDVEPHISLIESQSELTTSDLSDLIKIKRYSSLDMQDDIFELRNRQNIDGGFGSYLGFDSTTLDTANAIEALGFANNYQDEVVGSAVLFLLDEQNPDGGWSLNGSESKVYVTSAVLAGLRYYAQSYNLNEVLENGRSWLLAQKNSDGFYNSVLETAHALLGIIPLTIDTTLYSDTLLQLKDAQATDYSWDTDTYTTALALQVLSLSQSLTLPLDPSYSYIQGVIVDRSSGAPIENALISTAGTQVLTNDKGEFEFSLTTMGSYSIRFSANGYDPASMSLDLAQMKNVNLGELSLNPNPVSNTFSSLKGAVTDKNTGQPIADATIALSGSEDYSVTTSIDGEYALSIDEKGTYQLIVNSPEYHSIDVRIALSAGDHFEFSPSLTPVDEENVVEVSLSTSIVDGTTQVPLQNVTVDLAQKNLTQSLVSGINGEVSADQLIPGEVALRIEHKGYQPRIVTALLAQGKNILDGNIEIFPFDSSTFHTIIKGKILDDKLGLPLESVKIALEGTDSKLVETGENGDFTTQINAAGQYDIIIRKTGYHEMSSSIQIELGKELVLNTSMVPEGSESPIEVTLKGQAIDDVTGQVIPNAKLIITSDTQIIEEVAGPQGNWFVENIPTGNVNLTFSASGYVSQKANMLVAPGSNVDIGKIPMSLLPVVSQLSGLVIDRESGKPIAGAKVSLPGLQLSTTTDALGAFLIQDISALSFDIVVSAPGFVTNTRTLRLAEHQSISLSLDIEPAPENESGVGIRSSVSDQLKYGAYEKALINVDLYNHDNSEKELWFIAQIKQNDVVLQEMPIAHLAIPGDIADSQITMPAHTESLPIQFEWLTLDYAPGDYQLVLKALDLQTRQQLSSTQTNVTIEASSVIGGYEASVTPEYSNFEAVEDIELLVKLSHVSNESISSIINYKLLSPSETIMQSGQIPITLEPGAKTTIFSLDRFEQTIEESGKYRLRIHNNLNGETFSSESVLEVAPKVRIETDMSVTPSNIIPDGVSKKIHVDLTLSGRNEG